MEPLLLALLQQEATGVGIARFFAGFFLIVLVVGSAYGFTYWISKDE